jgi:hypothetical protein
MRPRPGGGGDDGQHRDDRSERSGEPQYQSEIDRLAAESKPSE